MRPRSLISASWSLLAVALVLWTATGYFAWVVLGMQAEHARYVGSAQERTDQETQSAQARSLARETATDRDILEKSSNIDVLTAVNTIESIGDSTGASVRVRDAQAEKSIAGRAGTLPVNAVNLSIESEGTFASIMRVLKMLETLPFSASIRQVSLGRAQPTESGKTIQWTMSVLVRVLTTATISS